MATISVCITHYNRPEKLGATLASLAAQTRQPDGVLPLCDCRLWREFRFDIDRRSRVRRGYELNS